MFEKRLPRLVVLTTIAATLVALPRPALALSSAPDPTWGTNGKTFGLAQYGNTLFVGGTFTKAISPSGQKTSVLNMAAFNITTGVYLPSFAATVQNTLTTTKPEVDALSVSTDGSTLYIGGLFDTVDGQPRQNFAAVDTATGTQLNPNVLEQPNTRVHVILAGPSLIYLGGNFTRIDGIDRDHLAAISAIDGSLSTTWVPTSDGGIDPCPSLLPPGTSCGNTSDGGDGNVHSMALAPDGNSLFLGGNFFYIDGVPRNSLARVSAVDGSIIDWKVPWATIPDESTSNPYQGPNVVWAILPTPTRVYIGYGRTPNGFEAFNFATTVGSGECATGCAARQWVDGTPGNAESLALSPDGTRLFVGGHFGMGVLDYQIGSCGGVYAHGFVSVNPINGAYYCDWFPQAVPFGGQNAPGHGVNGPNYVGGWAMQMTSAGLYVGGYFTSISGLAQSGIARFTLVGPPPPPPPAPVITSFTPASAPVGTPVTVTGSNFTGTTDVSFGTIHATFTVDTDAQISTVVPAGAVLGRIYVTNAGGTSKSASNFKVTVLSITGFTPITGPLGTVVTITGAGFTGATDVEFNGSPAAFAVVKDNKITTSVPGAATTGFISVTTPNGTVFSSTVFTVA